MMKFNWLLFILLLTSTLVNAQSFVYITDQVDIPMRSDKTFTNNIIKKLPSGSKLSLLQVTKDGWTQVKFKKLTGWVISRYLSNNPPARIKLKKLRQSYNANKMLISKQHKRNVNLESQVSKLKTNNDKLLIQIAKSKADTKHVKQTYQNALKLEYTNEKLNVQLLQLKTKIQLLKNNNIAAKESNSRNWFIVGGVVLFFGILAGFIFSSVTNRRRY